MPRLEDYRSIVGDGTLEEIRAAARPLRGRSVTHVNTTAVGGGVAEILSRMVPLMNELELKCGWDVMKGGEDFYAVTKKFHNALHGDAQDVTPKDYSVYQDTVDANMDAMDLGADFMFIHDPQPCAMVKARARHRNRWLWRCHIDVSRPQASVWDFLKPSVEKYDAMVISAPPFAQKAAVPQALIAPSIDPLSDKNRELTREEVDAVLRRLGVPDDKPLITQVSRFDRLKDPLGVIQAFKLAKKYARARLVLVGGPADDDPEGAQVLAEVREAAGSDGDILVLSLPPTSHVEVNALQRASAVVVQKSLREGFALTVSEALWKGKAVIAGAVGGIPLQVLHGRTGALVHTVEGAASWMIRFLKEPATARRMGEAGREHVRANFLLTRHLRDYLLLFLAAEHPGQDFIRAG
jgi:trehalose synthase